MAQNGDRTEKPTGRRRQRAREEGQFAHSQELTSAVTLAVCFVTLSYTVGNGSSFKVLMTSLLGLGTKNDMSGDLLSQMMHQTGIFFLTTIAPVAIAAALTCIVCNVAQGAPIFAANVTGLNWDKLNPITGLGRLKAKLSLMEWVKVILVSAVAFGALWSTLSIFWPRLVSLPMNDVNGANQIMRSAMTRLAGAIMGTSVVMSVGDYFLQRWKFEKSLKMTKQEVKEDNKAMEGDPAVKRKIKAIQRQQAQRRMMSRIKDADVVVTNPTHFAVALEYKPEKMGAPRVVAKGADFIAQKIKEVARHHEIPMVENVALARSLYKSVELEQEIPLELYKAVAEVLAYVFKARKKTAVTKR